MATPPHCEADHLLIVLIGNFNPAILQPRWMASEGVDLLGKEEADRAKLTFIAQDAAAFEVGDWLAIQASPDRFHATGPFMHARKIRDLVVGLFSVLEHTPISYLGVNRAMHFRMQDRATRDALGAKLAPPEVWPSGLAAPKFNAVRVQGARPKSKAQWLQMTVEPSLTVLDVGIFVASHEQFQLSTTDPLVDVLRSDFDDSVRFGRELAEALLSSAGAA
jgi:hypothetical protein